MGGAAHVATQLRHASAGAEHRHSRDSGLAQARKLDTTARYTQVATNIIREVMSPLDRLTPLVPKKDEPPA
jgi:hypothetical protein